MWKESRVDRRKTHISSFFVFGVGLCVCCVLCTVPQSRTNTQIRTSTSIHSTPYLCTSVLYTTARWINCGVRGSATVRSAPNYLFLLHDLVASYLPITRSTDHQHLLSICTIQSQKNFAAASIVREEKVNKTMMCIKMIVTTVILMLALLQQTEGFSVTRLQSSSKLSFSKLQPVNVKSPSSRGDMKMAMIPALASMGPISKVILGLPVMYMLFSANEYVTHRYYQHNEIGKMLFYKTLRKLGLFPKLDGGGKPFENVSSEQDPNTTHPPSSFNNFDTNSHQDMLNTMQRHMIVWSWRPMTRTGWRHLQHRDLTSVRSVAVSHFPRQPLWRHWVDS